MLLLRLIVLFLVCYVLFAVVRSVIGNRKRPSPSNLKPARDGEEMVLDPQCQSYVPKSEAIARSGGYFCSQECAQRYLTR